MRNHLICILLVLAAAVCFLFATFGHVGDADFNTVYLGFALFAAGVGAHYAHEYDRRL